MSQDQLQKAIDALSEENMTLRRELEEERNGDRAKAFAGRLDSIRDHLDEVMIRIEDAIEEFGPKVTPVSGWTDVIREAVLLAESTPSTESSEPI